MSASLEPPSIRRRRKAAEPAAEPSAERPGRWRRWHGPVVLVGVLAVAAATGIVLLVVSLGGGSDPRDEGVLPAAAPQQLPPEEYDAAALAGRTALDRWARPGLGYAVWWERLSPLLSPAARSAYAGTDPDQLPRLTIRPGAEVTSGPSADTATVLVATDAGRFGVDLTRRDAEAPWRVQRFLFPGEGSSL